MLRRDARLASRAECQRCLGGLSDIQHLSPCDRPVAAPWPLRCRSVHKRGSRHCKSGLECPRVCPKSVWRARESPEPRMSIRKRPFEGDPGFAWRICNSLSKAELLVPIFLLSLSWQVQPRAISLVISLLLRYFFAHRCSSS